MSWRRAVYPVHPWLKREVTVPVIAVGHILLELGERALRERVADMIVMGRALIADPHSPKEQLKEGSRI